MLVETEELAEVLSLADKVSDKDSTGLASVIAVPILYPIFKKISETIRK